jgi:hypothetical protein
MKSNLVAAIVLIVIGTILLLDNLGYVNVSLTRLLATWWPAILIVFGVGLLFKRRR